MHFRLSFPERKHQTGFGLLEVLVSLVIFASVGFTLLAWFQQSVDSVERLRSFYELQDSRKAVLVFAQTLNPMLQPKGETTYNGLRITWYAQPDGVEMQQIGYPRGTGRHGLRLYQATFSVFKESQTQPWFEEKITLVGHRLNASPVASSFTN